MEGKGFRRWQAAHTSPSRWHLVAGGGAGNAERIHGEGETTGHTKRRHGDSWVPAHSGAWRRTAFFLLFRRRAATVRTGLSPLPNGRRRWEAAGMAEGRPPRRSLHCHAPSLCHPNAALPVPARFRGDEGAIVVQAVKMDSESTWTRARPGKRKAEGMECNYFSHLTPAFLPGSCYCSKLSF